MPIQNVVNAYLTYNINNNSNDSNDNESKPPKYLSSFDDIIFQEYEEVDKELFLQCVSFHNGCSAGLIVQIIFFDLYFFFYWIFVPVEFFNCRIFMCVNDLCEI